MRRRIPVLVVVVTLAAVLLLLVRAVHHPAPLPVPAPPRERTPADVPRSPTVAFTASPESPAERHSTVIVPWETGPAATPSPTPPPIAEEPATRPGPSPTPDISECVTAQYSASMLAAAPGQVLVDIRAANRCGRDLAPLDVWFWVAGYRKGELVQAVRGHPFDPIPRDGEADVHIALPGSIDWYDRIEVRVVRPDAR